MIANVAHILAIELLAAAEGIEFLRPLRSSAPLEAAHAQLREGVPRFERDRFFAPEIERASALVHAGTLARAFREIPGLPALWTPV
jgi:histidine ammonia-lyase